MVCLLLVLLHVHVLNCTVLYPPTEGEGHIVFAADSIGISVTLNVCLISREPLADTDSYQIYIDIQHISLWQVKQLVRFGYRDLIFKVSARLLKLGQEKNNKKHL